MTKKLKILFVQDTFGELSEVFLYRINVGIQNFDVNVLTGSYINKKNFPFDLDKLIIWDKDISVWKKISSYINRTLKLKYPYLGRAESIISEINKSNADLVCFQFASIAVNLGTDIHKIKKKFCVIHHGSDLNKAVEDKSYRKRLEKVWEEADKIIFISEFLKNVANEIGCPIDKSIVHYLGVPTLNNFIKPEKLDNEKFCFISVARLVPVKNHINLIRAFSKVHKKSKKEVELVLIGAGELEEEIKREIENLGMKKYIKIKGGMSQDLVLSEIAKSDCLMLISKVYIKEGIMRQEEGLGLVLLEGSSLSIPLIGSKTGGIPEVVTNGVNGYLVDPLDITNISDAMLKLSEDSKLAKEMGNNARETVEKNFNIDSQIEKLEIIFNEIIMSEKRKS